MARGVVPDVGAGDIGGFLSRFGVGTGEQQGDAPGSISRWARYMGPQDSNVFGQMSLTQGPDLWGASGRAGPPDPASLFGVQNRAFNNWQHTSAAEAARAARLDEERRRGKPGTVGSAVREGVGDGTGDPATAKWRPLIEEAAREYPGMDPDRLQAIISFESNGNPGAVSPAGAIGLGQVMPENFRPGEDPYDPRTNIRVAARVLHDKYRANGNDWDRATMGYLGWGTDAHGTTPDVYIARVREKEAAIKARPRAQAGGAGASVPGFTPDAAFPVEGYQGGVSLHHGAHRGAADIFAPPGTRVVSMVGGTVTHAAYDELGGWNVYIQGDDGKDYYYAHLIDRPTVAAGQRVGRGAHLGGVGDSGNARGTGAHLHLGISTRGNMGRGGGAAGGAGDVDVTTWLNGIQGWGAQLPPGHHANDGHNH